MVPPGGGRLQLRLIWLPLELQVVGPLTGPSVIRELTHIGDGDDRGWDGWTHHGLDGRESGWTPGVGDGQRGLTCCNSWCRKESDTTERLNWTHIDSAVHSCRCFTYYIQSSYQSFKADIIHGYFTKEWTEAQICSRLHSWVLSL